SLPYLAPISSATLTPIFSYTTLFRSCEAHVLTIQDQLDGRSPDSEVYPLNITRMAGRQVYKGVELLTGEENYRSWALRVKLFLRSEEHTSELQSRGQLVCRLLLEKKK